MFPVAPKHQMTFGSAESLSVLADRFQFFTPALLYAYGALTDKPLLDFLAERPRWNGHIMYHHFKRKIFDGIVVEGDPSWEYVLWAMEKPLYPDFENFLCGVVLSDFKHRRLCKPAATDLQVPDPLAMDRFGTLPTTPQLPIVALGVDGSMCAIAMRTALTPGQRPSPLRFPPRRSTLLLAKAVFAEDQAAVVDAMGDPTPAALPPMSKVPMDARQSVELYRSLFRTP